MAVSPPRPKGPPLNTLRAFETAARLGGFAAAAEELHVTPGAVAQHVRALEAWCGANLFDRQSQGVNVTPLGDAILAKFTAAFDQLGDAVQALRAQAVPTHIRVAALPSIAQLWLSPRLPMIRAAVPQVAISVTAMESPPNLQRELFDLSIFFSAERGGADSWVICQDEIFPVCTPAVARRINDIADLKANVCLHDAVWKDDWALWSNSLKHGKNLNLAGPTFSLYSLALDEARHGAGLLVGHAALVKDDIDAGTLVVPFEHRLPLKRWMILQIATPSVANPLLQQIVKTLADSSATSNGHAKPATVVPSKPEFGRLIDAQAPSLLKSI